MRREASPRRALGERPEFSLDRNSPAFETAWVAVVVGATLFYLPLGPLTPLILIASVPAFALMRYEHLFRLLGDAWPLLLLPALAIVSALWSEVPATTVRYGILYLITALCGILMGGACRGESVLKGMFIGFFAYAVLSFASWRFVAWGTQGMAFAGLAGSKNTAGDIAGLSLVSAIAIIAWAAEKRSLLFALGGLVSLPITLFALWFSRATGAQLATAIAVFCTILWVLSRRLPVQARVTIYAAAVLAVIVAIVFQHLWLPQLFDLIVAESGKDAGLTGRVDLWRKADELIATRPWLGMGYAAFWLPNNLDAEYLWRLMGIRSGSSFNFHNTYREIVVHLGWVGFALFSIVAAIGSIRLLTKTMLSPRLPATFMCALLVFLIPKLPFEVIGFGTMHFATIISFAVLSMGFRSRAWMQGSGARRRSLRGGRPLSPRAAIRAARDAPPRARSFRGP